MRSLARSGRRILGLVLLCLPLAAGSVAAAAARPEPGVGGRPGPSVVPNRGQSGPVTLHRILRERVRQRVLRLIEEGPVAGGYGLLGLSDDPDPTANRSNGEGAGTQNTGNSQPRPVPSMRTAPPAEEPDDEGRQTARMN
jgi:hypothetical protein